MFSSRLYPRRLISTAYAQPTRRKRIIVAMTGATGAIYGIELLKALHGSGVETHTVLSKWAEANMRFECDYSLEDVKEMSSHVYGWRDLSAKISSGSFNVDGMVVAPCSMKTLAACRMGLEDNLISRAAGVCLKERRKLVLVTRETPLSTIHLENMLSLSQNGVVIFPPVPAFYHHPETLEDVVKQSVIRIIDQLDIVLDYDSRWEGGLTKKAKNPDKN